jgi:ATP-dependent exoDNAse (exonuclease V) beta subunit
MSSLHIITASAGSGKTYRLTELLTQEIASGSARPEAVMATTFTRKAAAELQERVRQRLIAQGYTNQANRLSAARLGTINAICGGLVTDFAFEKGLFPEAGVLDETAADQELRRSISRVVTQQQTQRLAELEYVLSGLSWTDAVNRIISLARYNGLDQTGLEQSKEWSVQSIKTLLGPVLPSGQDLDQNLKAALDTFIRDVDTEFDNTKKTLGALDTAQSVLHVLQQGRRLKWADWRKLSSLSPGKKSLQHAETLIQVAAEHDRHPELHRDLTDALSLVFDIAIQTLEMYQEHKRLWGVMDFADQESLALELLHKPEVVSHLQERLDLLLVDEFQDTSPLQLAILLKLAELSSKTVWVGDQKQSIYGFRGTDPALMDACLEELLKPGSDQTTETLGRSWRSRPPLVHLTSEVFSSAFEQHGIFRDQVCLAPALEDDPSLGPAVEWWTLEATNYDKEALALAQGIRSLLTEGTVNVLDKQTKKVRPVKPGDVGILCRTNDFCTKVADALAKVNIRAVLPSSGLLDTSEMQAMIAGLRLWVDSRDSLAAAELARLFHYPEQPDAWLGQLLEHPGEEAFNHLPEIRNLIQVSHEHPTAGVEQSLSLVSQALNIREWCLAWGNSDQRLAHLDALQAQAMEYIDACFQQGVGCTPAGFIAHLHDLHRNAQDMRNSAGGEDAVSVVTWHGSKGLEWPVTILSQIGKTFEPSPFGVQVMHDWQEFDVQNPLANRWLRYWLSPYHQNTKNSSFHDRVQDHPSMEAFTRQHNRQELRVLYVGWTRARDRLILAGRDKDFAQGMLGMLRDGQGEWLLSAPQGDQATWAGRSFEIRTRTLEPAQPEQRDIHPGQDYSQPGPREHPPARLSPSQMPGQGSVSSPERIGPRLSLSGEPDINVLGEAMHAFYAADRPEFDPQYRLNLAAEVINRWACSAWIRPESLVQSADTLSTWAQGTYPQAIWKREVPIMHRLQNGTQVFGFIDLLLETDKEQVIIDHKAFPGSMEEARKKTQEYVEQLAAYEQCLREVGSGAVVSYVHYPVVGCVVGVERG